MEPQIFTDEFGRKFPYWERLQMTSTEHNNLNQVATMCRLNILSAIQYAGSGHIGSSFSALEIMLASSKHLVELKNSSLIDEYYLFSSKGHDAPAFYATLSWLGIIEVDRLFSLRRLDGLPGHPEINVPGVSTNTGSLGMGISKAKGFAYGARLKNLKTKVITVLGDGELQEGQIWESMATAARDRMNEIVVIVDANGIQSDSWVRRVNPYEDLKLRVIGSGWRFDECDGHSFEELSEALLVSSEYSQPTFLVAKTTKGKGVPLFEYFPQDGEFYKFHSGALDQQTYEDACTYLIGQIKKSLDTGLFSASALEECNFDTRDEVARIDFKSPKVKQGSFVAIWSEVLLELIENNDRIVVLDADLCFDTGTYLVKKFFPDRYFQCGIAEQDMVSTAGTLALSNFIPIVHSFATFLTMRGTEQIFNNLTESSSIIYVGFLAGILPGGPGFSHQAVNDVAIMNAMPGIRIFEPSCEHEITRSLSECVEHLGPAYFRISNVGFGQCPNTEEIIGNFYIRRRGDSKVLLTSGPTLYAECLRAAELVKLESNEDIEVVTLPELTAALSDKERSYLLRFKKVFVVENFLRTRSMFDQLNQLQDKPYQVLRIGIENIPRNGQDIEVLKHHGLDSKSIASAVAGE